MAVQEIAGTRITAPLAGAGRERYAEVLTPAALDFLADLHRRFEPTRRDLLALRVQRQHDLDRGADPELPRESEAIRRDDWRVAPAPPDLQDRRVEITGPVERKMMINALNSGARVYMADFEDASSPTWDNCVAGQVNLIDAVRRDLELTTPEGKQYRLAAEVATLVVRPRGWHLEERHLEVDGQPIAAGLFDFGLFVFHNARELLERGSGPYLYLPKLEGRREARLWNEVFEHAQQVLGVPHGSIRATVLIENVLAAFEMDEILWELRDHSAGLNAGRWDYIFSVIRKFRSRDFALPDRGAITMTVPFMRAYTELLVATCHRRGAHAIGGMAAFIPNRRDPEVTERALAAVRDDKRREADDGFDGTWVAHPDLVPVATEIFDRRLGERPHQKDRRRDDVAVAAAELLDFSIPGAGVTEAGVRQNVAVTLAYLDSWLRGQGAAAIANLMEDTATAEISRTQLWQWLHHGVDLDDGRRFDVDLYREVRDQELERLGGVEEGRLDDAAEILDRLVLDDQLVEFLTWIAQDYLD
jgi:malate synthase